MKSPPNRSLFVREQNNAVRPLVPEGKSRLENHIRSLGIGVEVHQFDELENLDIAPLTTTLGLNLSDPVDVEFKTDANWYTNTFGYNDVGIYSAEVPFSARLREKNRGILIALDDRLFSKLLPDRSRRDLMGIQQPMVTKDVYLAESLRLLAKHAAGLVGRNSLYAETIATSMAIHLITRYGNPSEKRDFIGSSVTDREILPKINAYILANINADIRLSALSEIAGLSPFHFSRRFKAVTGTSPYRYVMDRRLDKGIELLRTSRIPISQIALEVGFCDQSHFTRELSKSYGVTPNELRKSR